VKLQTLQKSVENFYPQVVAISLIILTILIVYWQDLAILVSEALQNEAVNHVLLVPLLASFLVFRKREFVKASFTIERSRARQQMISLSEITGIALCLFAFLLYWYGSYTFYSLEYHIASLIVFVTGTGLTLFSVKVLTALIFPLLFLIFLIPPPSGVTSSVGALVGNFNAQGSYTLLKAVGTPVTLSSEYGPPTLVINNPAQSSLEFVVDLPCSGVYSLVAFAMFATFLVYVVRGPIARKIVIFPLGFLTLTILNIFRISLILTIAHQFGEAIAMTVFHVFSGWLLIFIGMLLLLLIAERLLNVQIFGSTNKNSPCPKCDDLLKSNEIFCSECGRFFKNHRTRLPRKFWIKTTALLIASYLVTLSIQAPVFAFAQGLTMTTANPETGVDAFPQVSEYQLRFLYRDQSFEKISHQDASLLYAYISQNISNPTVYVLVGVANSITHLHSWEVCLVTWQQAQGNWPLVNVLESRDIQIMQNPPITAHYFVFQSPSNYTQIALYWYQKALFKTPITIESRYTRISLIILTKNPNDSPKLEQKLTNMGKTIAAYWEPLKVQSLISLGIPTMQILLVSTILFAIVVQTTQYTREWRRKTTNLKIFEKLGSLKEKQLYQAIKELRQKTKETTTSSIASALRKATGKAARPDELIGRLRNLEEHGIIKADIMSILDQPRLVWKP